MNTYTTEHMLVWRGFALAVAMSGFVTAVTGCTYLRSDRPDSDGSQWIEVVPKDEGLYAYNGEDLVRLDGDDEWEKKTWGQRSNLPANSEFVIRDPALAELAGSPSGAIGLRKVAWVRSTISGAGQITPVLGNNWRSAPLPSLEVPLDYATRTESHPDLVRVRAQQPLEPGLYAFHVETAQETRNARFGIAWPETDKQAYSASVCVDQYVGENTGYRLCNEQNLAGATDKLQIYLVQPETRPNGTGRSMVISGVILNNSNNTQTVPLLTAELRNTEGQALTSWRFKANSTQLEPGQSTSFRTEVDRTPQQVHSVNVNFASTQAFN